jgi:hypothetical protein
MNAPFQPIGVIARWRTIYSLLVARQVDDVLDYGTMAAALDLNVAEDRYIMQASMRRAAKEFEQVDKHAVVAIPGVGYRIVEPEEHLVLAKAQQRRSSRALVRGYSKVTNVDMSDLTPANRMLFQAVAQAFAMQQDFNRRTDIRQAKLEEALDGIREKTVRTDDEIAELRARLNRLEEERDDGE